MNKNYWNACHIVFIHSFDKSLWGNPSSVILEEDSLLMEIAVSGERQTANQDELRKENKARKKDGLC